jgi:hypothetical protein
LLGAQPEALAREPLLGDADLWKAWFTAAGLQTPRITMAAVFNDAGLMLQAAEQNFGLALSREILAADALRDGQLVQLSQITITHPDAQPYHLVYPPGLRDWPPLVSCGIGCATSSTSPTRRCVCGPESVGRSRAPNVERVLRVGLPPGRRRRRGSDR